MRPMTRLPCRLACLLLAALLAACATPPPADDPDAVADFNQTNDPLEPTNRVLFAVNTGIDAVVLRPIVAGYRAALPETVREHVRNALTNLGGPVVLANDMLQGKPRLAGNTLVRLALNSTLGVGGVFDVATGWGYPAHANDFGITLADWGVGEGPFLFLPLLGPNNPRDLTGYAVDVGLDPLTYLGKGSVVTDLGYARTGMIVVDTLSTVEPELDKALSTALDPYATYRSLYRQYRAGTINRLAQDGPATPPAWYAPPASH